MVIETSEMAPKSLTVHKGLTEEQYKQEGKIFPKLFRVDPK